MSTANTRSRRGPQSSTDNKLSDMPRKHVERAIDVGRQAVSSGAWWYPLRGIIYMLANPNLVRPLVPALVKGLLMAGVTVLLLFTFTYLPQVAILAFVSGPLAFVGAVALVLGEAYILVNWLARNFVLASASVDLFDAVLVQKGHTVLVQRGREVTSTGKASKQLGGLLTKPFSKLNSDNIVRYVLSLPLNLIPVVGTVFFLGYNGSKAGPGYHARYFQLKGFDSEKRKAAIQKRRGAYTAFGTVAMLLNLVPVVSILFQLTTTIGAALWASDLESQGSTKDVGGEGSSVQVSLPDAAAARKEL
ncbi:hypothetical protein BCR39DRAFT_537237 [Naematelia encephala]|uniref:Outer spore wall protein RRT8 n=1 Tax=Naematelia encephala TaxID=71784 RepID=A0A1Y2AYZ8_9TREE|nr:hypothetical protein BCR39DRAFT_537237 [Naematelia encephala]